MPVVVYRAREIITLDASCPIATAVAVNDGRVLHVGTYEEVSDGLRDQTFSTNDQFIDRVMVPGFIEAHGHLTLDGSLGHLVWTGYDDRRRPDGSVSKGCRSLGDVIERLRERANDVTGTVVGLSNQSGTYNLAIQDSAGSVTYAPVSSVQDIGS